MFRFAISLSTCLRSAAICFGFFSVSLLLDSSVRIGRKAVRSVRWIGFCSSTLVNSVAFEFVLALYRSLDAQKHTLGRSTRFRSASESMGSECKSCNCYRSLAHLLGLSLSLKTLYANSVNNANAMTARDSLAFFRTQTEKEPSGQCFPPLARLSCACARLYRSQVRVRESCGGGSEASRKYCAEVCADEGNNLLPASRRSERERDDEDCNFL